MKLEVGQIWQRCLPSRSNKYPDMLSWMFEITKLTNTRVYVKYLDCPTNRNNYFGETPDPIGKEVCLCSIKSFQESIKDGYLIYVDNYNAKILNDCLTSLKFMSEMNKDTLTDTQINIYNQCVELSKYLKIISI